MAIKLGNAIASPSWLKSSACFRPAIETLSRHGTAFHSIKGQSPFIHLLFWTNNKWLTLEHRSTRRSRCYVSTTSDKSSSTPRGHDQWTRRGGISTTSSVPTDSAAIINARYLGTSKAKKNKSLNATPDTAPKEKVQADEAYLSFTCFTSPRLVYRLRLHPTHDITMEKSSLLLQHFCQTPGWKEEWALSCYWCVDTEALSDVPGLWMNQVCN